MANLFDATNAPEGVTTEIVVGDFIQFKRSDLVADYPTDEYTATLVARKVGASTDEIQIEATGQTTHFLFTASSSTTAGYAAGSYNWQLEIVQDSSSNRAVVDKGDFVITADLDVDQADIRTHAEITLGKIESLIQGKADNDAQEYSIAGRQLKKYSFNELLSLRDYYKKEVAKEKAERDIKQGRKSSSTVKVRFM